MSRLAHLLMALHHRVLCVPNVFLVCTYRTSNMSRLAHLLMALCTMCVYEHIYIYIYASACVCVCVCVFVCVLRGSWMGMVKIDSVRRNRIGRWCR